MDKICDVSTVWRCFKDEGTFGGKRIGVVREDMLVYEFTQIFSLKW